MTATQDDTIAELQRANAELRRECNAALLEKATLAEALAARDAALAQRDSEFGERIEHQAATIDVLKVMSASPGDAQPVFELIVRHATELCNVPSATLFEYDGELVHIRSDYRSETILAPSALAAYVQLFPMRPMRGSISCRAILDRQIIHIRDLRLDPELAGFARELGHRSQVSVPLIRDDLAIGVITIGAQAAGGFSDSQVELLKTFAEQAVIAITSAETYRALQERTAALAARNSEYGERIEQQAATIDVLKVMSSSPGNAQPVFQLIVERAQAFCGADQTNLALLDGDMLHLEATSGASASYPAQFPRPVDATSTFGRAIIARDVVQTPDVLVDPDHFRRTSNAEATVRAVVAVPLLRRGEPVGAIAMGRNIPGEFSATQMELLKTFAEQAVIAITSAETYRALQTRTSDLQQSLEYQTATSDVLKVISRSAFDLQPVLDTVVETAARLCDADQAVIGRREGDKWRLDANFGFPPEYEAYYRERGLFSYAPDTPSSGARVAREGRIVHIDDVAAVPGYPEASIRLGKQRTSLGVPLLRDGEVIGTIILARQRVEPFTDRQIELVSTFADQAVIAIENTRLITEQREALEQQTATAEVLQVINASPGDLKPVFDAIVEKAMRLCGAAFGALTAWDGKYANVAAMRGFPPALVEYMAARGPRLAVSPVIVQLSETKRPQQLPDVMAGEGYRNGHPDSRAVVDLGGARTILHVPLRRDDAMLGYISVYRKEVRVFSDKEIALLENFAAQAVIAMENARLLTEQREALEQQTATAEVLQVINASPGNLTPVFDAMLDKAMRLCEASYGELRTYDGQTFHIGAMRGVPENYARFMAQSQADFGPETGPGRVLRGEPLVHILDLADTDNYRAGEPNRRALVDLGGAHTLLLVPLRKDEEMLGYIMIYRTEVRPFTDKQIALLQNFAAQAVIAMENARLLGELRARTRDLEELLEYQTATSDVLQVISRSDGKIRSVLDTMVKTATRICVSDSGLILQLQDDGKYHIAASVGCSPEFLEHHAHSPTLPERGTVTGRAAVERRVVQIEDAATDPEYVAARSQQLGQTRTMLGVPLLRDGTVTGVITLFRQRVEPFTDRQIELVRTFADQAVIAIENARLITETREALEQQTATAEVLQVINSSPGDLSPVFDAILEKAHSLCGADHGSLSVRDGDRFRAVATYAFSKAWAERLREGMPVVDNPVAEALLDGADFVHYANLAEIDHPLVRASVDASGVRTALFVPLRKDGVLLGHISAVRQEVRPFTDKQITLLQNFAAQAVIAMENARLLTEQREALEQQTATSEVLQVINASPGNLAPVFDAMLEKALHLCEAAFGVLWTYDGERIHAVALRGMRPAFAEFLTRTPHSVGPDNAHGRLLHGEPVVHIADLMDDEAYRSGDPMRRSLVELGGGRTLLAVPLRKDEAFLGDFVIYRQEVRPFSGKQIVLLKNFADQAVIAMENARLVTEQREALEQQTATADLLQVINASPGNLAPVFEAMLERAMRVCEAAFGALWSYDGEYLHVTAVRGVPAAYEQFLKQGPHRPSDFQQRLLHTEPFEQIPDLTLTEAYRTGQLLASMGADLGGTRTLLAVPLRKDGKALGIFGVYRQEVRPFTDKQIVLLQSFAAQAVIAMENARLLNEIRQRQEELRITFENMGDGVAMFDETQHLVAWNRKFQDILDVPDEVIARRQTFREYVRYLADRGEYGAGPEVEEHVRGLVEQAGRSRTYERNRPDGRVIEVRHNPVPDGGFVLIFSDITERKRSEAEIRAARDAAEEASRTIEAAYRELKTAQANLIQAEKMASLGQLTAGIAHEIKNPLNFVNNFAELSVDLLGELKDAIAPAEPALTEKQRAEIEDVSAMLTSNLEKITEHGKRADGIVKAMLEHSRGSSGERRMVDLNTLIDEALNLAYHGARAQDQSFNITLERDFGEGIAPIEVNPQDITRVFLNIFSNGFYATTRRARDGGDAGFEPTLKVTTRNAEEAVEIRVRDNGTGVPADIRDKMFQPFFTTKPTGEGTGLGLSITYDIVTQQHGGNIAVDSKVGEYSEFTIQLPRYRP